MNTIKEITLDDFRNTLTSQHAQSLQGMKIIQLALSMGVVMFAAVVLFFHFGNVLEKAEFSVDKVQQMMILSFVHGFIAACCYFVGWLIALQKLNPKNFAASLSENATIEDIVKKFVGTFRGLQIIRLALAEGPALFGIVVCFLAVNTGVIEQRPVLWCNYATTVLFVIIAVVTLPTANSVTLAFRQKIKEPLELYGS